MLILNIIFANQKIIFLKLLTNIIYMNTEFLIINIAIN